MKSGKNMMQKKVSNEELKKYSLAANKGVASIAAELIAFRELKGEQVPVAWTSQRSLETKNKIVAFTDDMSALDYGVANGWTDIVELFTAPQKPVIDLSNVLKVPYKISGQHFTAYDTDDLHAAIEAAGGIVKESE